MDGWEMRAILLLALAGWVATMCLMRLLSRQRERALREVSAEIEQQRKAKAMEEKVKGG